jgi:hypothetical protein
VTIRFQYLVMATVLTLTACFDSAPADEPSGGAAQEQAEAMSRLEVSQVTAKLVFDGQATEVAMTIENRRSTAITLTGLRDHAGLTLADGSVLSLHEISVGVAKPLAVPAKSSVTTSLLFKGNGTRATALQLLKAKVPVQPGS